MEKTKWKVNLKNAIQGGDQEYKNDKKGCDNLKTYKTYETKVRNKQRNNRKSLSSIYGYSYWQIKVVLPFLAKLRNATKLQTLLNFENGRQILQAPRGKILYLSMT